MTLTGLARYREGPPVKLREYRKKRTAGATTEPFGGDPADVLAPTRRGSYVVHLHDATRTHYDLRLEMGGVLSSFAVPRGPSLDPESKHLAVHTEDHPLEYLDFEDVIPEGQYGAGPMIVWDRGRVEFLENTAEDGLKAGKLDFVLEGYKLHGRFALVRLKKGDKEWLLLKKKDAWADAKMDIVTEQPQSVLSGLTIEELSRARELGTSLEAECAAIGARAREVDARDLTPMLPADTDEPPSGRDYLHELSWGGVRVLAGKAGDDAMIMRGGNDVGELYPEIARAVQSLAPSRVVLDGEIVAWGEDGRPSTRKLAQRLERARSGDAHGALLEARLVMVVSDLLALGGRDLRALPLERRRAILARLLPAHGVLRASDTFEGDPAPLVAFCKQHALPGVLSRRKESPYKGGTKPNRTWTRLVVTESEPVNLDAPVEPAARNVPITNRHKEFWHDEGYTKGDLVDYYQAIAPAILPYLKDRPIAVVRYPDGIHGKNFYQWNVPPGMPRWVNSFALKDEETEGGEKRVFLVNDLPSLLYIANLACIPIHILACRKDALNECDFFTIDFDLKLAKLEHAVMHALTLRRLLDKIGLVGHPKSSGQSGLHVLVPLGRGVSFVTARALADLLGRLIVEEHPDTATTERIVKKRGDKVYVDTGQTGPTRTIVAPYSVRAHPGATVSTPLTWDEVSPKLDPKRFTIRTVPERFAKLGDPMHPMLSARPDVAEAVKELEALVSKR